jgi:hypothetical protein
MSGSSEAAANPTDDRLQAAKFLLIRGWFSLFSEQAGIIGHPGQGVNMKLPSVQQVCLEAKRAACRFPFVLSCAFVGVIAALRLIEIEPAQKSSLAYPILLAAALGLPLLAALVLSAEKRKWSPGFSLGAQLLGIVLLLLYAFTVPANLPNEPAAHIIRFGLLAAGLSLLVMIAPYLKEGELNGFWQYNKALFFRLFVAAVFSLVLFAGLAIALAALDNLFGVSVPGKRYAELWVLVAGLFFPWFFLSGVPEDLGALDRIEEYPKGLKVFAQYILLSLVIVYLVILYAYLLKIVLQWSWPKGWVSSLILGFSATSILSLLLMHPIRDQSGNAWIRAAGIWLYVVLIPLIVVLFLAVTERIGDYGITESRYAGIALGIWLSAQVLYFLFSRPKSIKFTVGSLCLLAFLMSCGPWGMLGVSQRSQVRRLAGVLAKDGILVNGKVQKEHGRVTQEDAREISSIISYLSGIHGYNAIRPWFGDQLRGTSSAHAGNPSPSSVLDRMGIEYVEARGGQAGRTFVLNPLKPADISGYDRILGQQAVREKPARFDGDGVSYVVSDDLGTMTVMIGDPKVEFTTVQVDIGSFARKLMREHGQDSPSVTGSMEPEAMALSAEQNGQKVKLLFRNLRVIRRDGSVTIPSFTADIAYTVRK